MRVTRNYVRSFSGATETGTDFLIGNTGESVAAQLTVVGGFYFAKALEDSSEGVSIEQVAVNQFKVSEGEWEDYGFDVGNQVHVRLASDIGNGNPHTARFEITYIEGDIAEFDNYVTPDPDFTGTSNTIPFSIGREYPGTGSTLTYTDLVVFTDEPVQGVRIKYALQENNATSPLSLVDGTTTEFFFPDLTSIAIGDTSSLTAAGTKSGLMMLDANITRLPNDTTWPTSVFYEFERPSFRIDLEYVIDSFWENQSDILAGTTPNFLEDVGSLSDIFEIDYTQEFNNENISVTLNSASVLGTTGWFNENFNGLPETITLNEVRFFNAQDVEQTSLAYNAPTKVVVRVDGVDFTDTANIKVQPGIMWIPETESFYKNLERDRRDSLLFNNTFATTVAPKYGFNSPLIDSIFPDGVTQGNGYDGIRLDTSSVSLEQDGAQLVFRFTVIPTFNAADFFDGITERDFAIWLSVTDNFNLDSNLSNRVSLLHTGEMIKREENDGPYPILTTFLPHPAGNEDNGLGGYYGFPKDDLLARMYFKVDAAEVSELTSMSFAIEAVKSSGLTYVLQETEVPLTGFPVNSDGAPEIDVQNERGFRLEDGNNKNEVTIIRESSGDTGTEYAYLARYAWKMRWEDWLLRQGVPADFVDSTLPLNGINNDWFHYDNADWDLKYVIKTRTIESGETKNYRNEYKFTLKDYEDNSSVAVTHEYYRDSDNTLLNNGTFNGRTQGAILNDEPTRIEITYQLTAPDAWTIANVYAVTTIEVYNGQGQFELRQLSSEWGSEDDNPLGPVAGEIKLKVELIDPQTVKTTCLVDPSLLQDATRYEISGRIGEFIQTNFTIGIYDTEYEESYE